MRSHPKTGLPKKQPTRGLVPASFLVSAARSRDLGLQGAMQAAPHFPVLAQLVFVIVHLGPRLERGLRLRVELARRRAVVQPEGREVRLDLPDDVRLEDDDILRVFAGEQGEIVHVENANELLDRGGMVIDADVNPPVVEACVTTPVPDDEDRCTLLAPLVAPGALACAQRREEAHWQVALRHLEGTGQRLQDFLSREDVPLSREVSADDMSGPREAFFPGVRRGATARVDDADLALRRVLVSGHEPLHDILRCDATLQHREGVAPVRRVRVRLRRHGSDPGRRERHDGPDRHEFRFDGDAEILRLGIERDDAERGRSRPMHRRWNGRTLFRDFPVPATLKVDSRLRVYVATGGSETNDAALRGAGLFDLIDQIFTGHSQNAQKGQSRYWQEIPHQLGVKPRDCVLVDDRLDYLEAAASVGIVALLLDRKAAHRPESMPPYVEATLRNLAGLPHWVELWTATRHN